MKKHESILILDFGSQYTQLIGRRIRELNVFCEIHPFTHLEEALKKMASIKGIVLSGSPASVREKGSPRINLDSIRKKYPVLGVCYGAQLLSSEDGGEVMPSETREYGRALLNIKETEDELFFNIKQSRQVWMSHSDTIKVPPAHASILASTETVSCAAFRISGEKTYGIQFHPEVTHTEDGLAILKNFVLGICGCKGDWTPGAFVSESVEEIRKTIGDEKVLLGLSGGVDSSVAALILNRAIGKNLYCIFIDNGLLRKNEFEEVLSSYQKLNLNVKGIRAGEVFLKALSGISNPEEKRKIIGRTFIEVFDEAAHHIQDVKWLGQGTIYPDVIESVSVKGPSATIKSHHNVGGLPEKMKLKLTEPLRNLFKDEVRRVGKELDLPENILNRHPFPGPGLAVRILGEINESKVKILQEADALFIQGLKDDGLYDKVWQAGAVFLPVRSVGVMGDERTYENAICLRAVNSTDGMTADWSRLPHDFLAKVSNAIINRVKGVNRVVFDISSKPPATIEWE